MTQTKIIIAGIGGVGGYFGGLLAKHYHDDDMVSISFMAREKHVNQIRACGLKVLTTQGEFTAQPTMVTHQPNDIGIADFIIVCTKSYDLEEVMQQLQPCINETTVLLPLLNGVNSRERIKAIYPNNLVLDGCVYIVSHILAPGVVENKGNIQTLYFGLDNYSSDQLVHFEQLFHQADIEATLSKDISTIIWEKFIFLSPIATATSYYNKSIGEIISTKESLDTTIALIKEVEKIAIAKKIKISENTIEKTLHKYQSLPFESTSSMHNDFKNKKINTELSTLTGYVISEGKKYAVATPTYSKLHAILEKKRNL